MPTLNDAAATFSALKLVNELSLEMTGRDLEGLVEARDAIPTGTRINCTFLGSEDLELRVKTARSVLSMGFVPVPHISARRLHSEAALRELLHRLQDIGATRSVFTVAGDPSLPRGPYPDSLSIIRSGLLQKHGAQEVGIAGYPEGHPDIPGEVLWQHLEEKAQSLEEQGLDGVILTQFGFDVDPIVKWVSDVRARGIDLPIRIGIPGPAGVKRLLGFARRFGIGANAMIVRKYGFSLTNLMGTAGPDRLIADLAVGLRPEIEAGLVGVHMYTFGGLQATAQWAQEYITEAS